MFRTFPLLEFTVPQKADLATMLEAVAAVTMRHVTADCSLPIAQWFGPADHVSIVLGKGHIALVFGDGSVTVTDNARLLTPQAHHSPLPPREDLAVRFQQVLEDSLRKACDRYTVQISN